MAPVSPNDISMGIRPADPADADWAYRAALGAMRSGREEDGLALLEPARRAHPGDARLWQVAGLIHRRLDDLEPAIAALSEAARLAPADALIAHTLAQAHLEAGLPASHLFRSALRLRENDAQVLLGLAAALFAEERAGEAIETLDSVLDAHPQWLAGHDTVCRLRWQSGQREDFTASIERALAARPADLDLWRGLLVILTQGDLYERALEAVQRGRRSAGENLLFTANEAVCRSELGQAAEAERLFAEVGHLDDATIRLRYVRHLLRTGRPAEAAALAEAMTRTPAAHMFWPYLATAWRLTSDRRWEWLEGDPRLVGIYDLTPDLPPLADLAETLRGLHVAKEQPLEQSVRGGTQTDGALFARIEPEMRALRRAVAAAVERHVAQLPPPDPSHPTLAPARGGRVRFAGSWSVRLLSQGHHSNHVHPAGWLSSALYVSLPGEEERGEPPAGWLSLGEPHARLGLELPPFRLVEPKPGRLVLFPSTLWHGTVPFESGERLTVAFDVARPL
jgi:cytochrome c-type biogenesis protein CcmH/NrfG